MRKSSFSPLHLRVFTAAVLLPLALYWILLMPMPGFFLVLAGFSFLVMFEALKMSGMPTPWFYASALLSGLFCMISEADRLLILVLVLFSFMCICFISHRARNIAAIAPALLLSMFVATVLIILVAICQDLMNIDGGRYILLGIFCGVWAADTAGYFVGKAWGHYKLAPGISPGKTLEGTLGAIVFGTLASVLVWYFFVEGSTVVFVGLAILTVVASIIGDLMESTLKRMVGVKDSGNLLPGHGGILDRVDGILIAVPCVAGSWMFLQ